MAMTKADILDHVRTLPSLERLRLAEQIVHEVIEEGANFEVDEVDSATDGSDFDEEERARLFAAIDKGVAAGRAGEYVDAEQFARELLARTPWNAITKEQKT